MTNNKSPTNQINKIPKASKLKPTTWGKNNLKISKTTITPKPYLKINTATLWNSLPSQSCSSSCLPYSNDSNEVRLLRTIMQHISPNKTKKRIVPVALIVLYKNVNKNRFISTINQIRNVTNKWNCPLYIRINCWEKCFPKRINKSHTSKKIINSQLDKKLWTGGNRGESSEWW